MGEDLSKQCHARHSHSSALVPGGIVLASRVDPSHTDLRFDHRMLPKRGPEGSPSSKTRIQLDQIQEEFALRKTIQLNTHRACRQGEAETGVALKPSLSKESSTRKVEKGRKGHEKSRYSSRATSRKANRINHRPSES